MIRRSPSWAWIALVAAATAIFIVGALTTFAGKDDNDAKAAEAETRGCERSGSVTTCSLSLPTDGSKSEAIRASNFSGKLDWEATGPVGTLACPDDDPCVRLREGAEAREVLKFARLGGGEVTVTLVHSD